MDDEIACRRLVRSGTTHRSDGTNGSGGGEANVLCSAGDEDVSLFSVKIVFRSVLSGWARGRFSKHARSVKPGSECRVRGRRRNTYCGLGCRSSLQQYLPTTTQTPRNNDDADLPVRAAVVVAKCCRDSSASMRRPSYRHQTTISSFSLSLSLSLSRPTSRTAIESVSSAGKRTQSLRKYGQGRKDETAKYPQI